MRCKYIFMFPLKNLACKGLRHPLWWCVKKITWPAHMTEGDHHLRQDSTPHPQSNSNDLPAQYYLRGTRLPYKYSGPSLPGAGHTGGLQLQGVGSPQLTVVFPPGGPLSPRGAMPLEAPRFHPYLLAVGCLRCTAPRASPDDEHWQRLVSGSCKIWIKHFK